MIVKRCADSEDWNVKVLPYFIGEHFLAGTTQSNEENPGPRGLDRVHKGSTFGSRQGPRNNEGCKLAITSLGNNMRNISAIALWGERQ